MADNDNIFDISLYVKAPQAAKDKGVSASTVYSAIRQGVLPCRQLLESRPLYILKTDLEAWEPSGHGGARPNSGMQTGSKMKPRRKKRKLKPTPTGPVPTIAT